MVSVRFFDGDGENGQPIFDVEMIAPPQIGTTVRFDWWNAKDEVYRVTAIEHKIKVVMVDNKPAATHSFVIVSTQLI
ncbi:hypothetical protein [Sphingomonas sp. VDB2]|uniref:hypothetical protein n=1 Tax=Sphingomonas sp. VDB2 TaxID=3228751 RepID=UPI003A80D5E9